MSVITVHVEIDHGRIVPREPEMLPDVGSGVLTIFETGSRSNGKRERIRLPLIHGDGKHFINPTAEEIDSSLWDE